MLEWIKKKLQKRLECKKQDVIRLRWQKVQLENKLDQAKKQSIQ